MNEWSGEYAMAVPAWSFNKWLLFPSILSWRRVAGTSCADQSLVGPNLSEARLAARVWRPS